MSDPSSAPLGTLHRDGEHGAVRIEVVIDAPATAVWRALTEPDHLSDWLGDVSGDLRTGGRFRACFRVSGWNGAGRVESCDERRGFVVVLREDDGAGDETTAVTLTTEQDGTRLVVRQTGLPLTMVAAFGAGLQVHLEDLVAHLAGRPGRNTVDRWSELHPGYQELTVLEG